MQFGVVSPASAVSMSADTDTIATGQTALFTTDAPLGTLTAFFVNDERFMYGPYEPPLDTPWDMFAPCENADLTVRVYDEAYSGTPSDYDNDNLTWETPYNASYTIGLVGNATWPNCISYGTSGSGGSGGSGDSGESLANTGSDSSTLVGLTGVAGVAALAVSVAVARRTRRAQR
jgi:hypothetical protein